MKFIFVVTAVSVLLTQMTSGSPVVLKANNRRISFASNLYQNIAKNQKENNVIISPASIEACMMLAYFAADGKTAKEIETILSIDASSSKEDVAKKEGDLLRSSKQHGAWLEIANRIFVKEGNEIAPKFNEIAIKHFDSEAEQINFKHSIEAVQKINSWVESKTNNKIKKLMDSGDVDSDTEAVLVNAIYFKGLWEIPFSTDSTRQMLFSLSPLKSVSVDMMYEEDEYRYGELKDIDATAVELAYKNSDISMLVILPNKVDGLKALEESIVNIDITKLGERMSIRKIHLYIPKFKVEFNLSIKKTLSDMGIKSLFSNGADLSGLFTKKTPIKISDAHHKAFLEVNEAGSVAAAASFMKIVPMSLTVNQKTFRADHPFMFLIKNKDRVFFCGHVVKF